MLNKQSFITYGKRLWGGIQRGAKYIKQYQQTIDKTVNFIENPSIQTAYSAITTGLKESNVDYSTPEFRQQQANPKYSKITDYQHKISQDKITSPSYKDQPNTAVPAFPTQNVPTLYQSQGYKYSLF